MQTTFPKLLLQHASQRPAAPAMREKEYGIWQTLAWRDLAQMVEHLACGLHQAGLHRGEHMVIIGAKGQGAITSALLGSVSQEVAHASPVPVTIVKHAEVLEGADSDVAEDAEV